MVFGIFAVGLALAAAVAVWLWMFTALARWYLPRPLEPDGDCFTGTAHPALGACNAEGRTRRRTVFPRRAQATPRSRRPRVGVTRHEKANPGEWSC